MRTPFIKMHGIGNDFMVLDCRAKALPLSSGRIRALADRRTGVGFDQMVLIETSAVAEAFMRIHNPDGSEAGACGNASRCVAALLAAEGGLRRLHLETASGVLEAWLTADGRLRVDMGEPAFGWRDIPLASPMDTLRLDIPGHPAAASMGNPHLTFFVEDMDAAPVEAWGARWETDSLLPQRANIGFVQVVRPNRLRLRVWERGAGLTRACGSGACAALVNAHRRGLAARWAELEMDGGVLDVEWTEEGRVLMAGPAAIAYNGEVDLESFPA